MKYLSSFLALFLTLGVTGCAGLQPVLLQDVKIYTDKDTNDGNATSVDVVIVHDKELLTKLTSMKSTEYFSQADELEENNPQTLERFHFEVIAGSSTTQAIKLKSYKPGAAIIFADIKAPGTHRYRVNLATEAQIKLLHGSMEVKELENFKLNSLIRKGRAWVF